MENCTRFFPAKIKVAAPVGEHKESLWKAHMERVTAWARQAMER